MARELWYTDLGPHRIEVEIDPDDPYGDFWMGGDSLCLRCRGGMMIPFGHDLVCDNCGHRKRLRKAGSRYRRVHGKGRITNPLCRRRNPEAGDEIDPSLTQRANTDRAYRQAGDMIPAGSLVVDFGAGLGLGTQHLGDNTVSYEPFPNDRKIKAGKAVSPDYLTVSGLLNRYKGKADAVVNNYVLNVVEPEIRDQIVRDIAALLKKGGIAYIAVRSRSDVNSAKRKQAGGLEPDGWYIQQKTKKGKVVWTYQKGFTQKELESYVLSLLPKGKYGIAKSKHAPAGSPAVMLLKL